VYFLTENKNHKMAGKLLGDLLPGLFSGGGNIFGNPFDAPWGNDADQVDPYAPVSDANGTRVGDSEQKDSGIVLDDPNWGGSNIIRDPNMWWGLPTDVPDQIDIVIAPPPTTIEPPRNIPVVAPTPWDGGDRGQRQRADESAARSRAASDDRFRQAQIDRTNARPRNEDDFLRKRREREAIWQNNQDEERRQRELADDVERRQNQQQQGWENDNDNIPRGTLLPEADDWTDDLNQDPNETDAERDSRRRRSEWIRRGTNAAIIGIGGLSAAEAARTWKDRVKWVAKNSGTTQQRQYPLPPSIPNSGQPSDLDPSAGDLPVYPAQPNPRAPIERTVGGWIRPIDTTDRASSMVDTVPMDCSC
jgi:hypothetical protein